VPCGISGRIVVDLEPGLKLRFDAKLKAEGISKKDWLMKYVKAYVAGFELPLPVQLPFDLSAKPALDRFPTLHAAKAGLRPSGSRRSAKSAKT
jgi:hypothetical protein